LVKCLAKSLTRRSKSSPLRERRHALDLDQHLRIGQRLHQAAVMQQKAADYANPPYVLMNEG
jgi:hypothetical protein